MLVQAKIVKGRSWLDGRLDVRSGHSWRTVFTDVRVGGGVAASLAAADPQTRRRTSGLGRYGLQATAHADDKKWPVVPVRPCADGDSVY
jgi:hypothetical protein